MSIYLGNLSITEIEEKAGLTLPTELKTYMEPRRQHAASSIAEGQWHCFDIPFMILCGDVQTAKHIHESLLPIADDFVTPIQIGF